MTPYEYVLDILRSVYLWTVNEAPHPDPTNTALQSATPEQVAARLDGWVRAKAANMTAPWGYPVQGSEGAYLHLRYRTFNGGEMWARKTDVALGGKDDVSPDTIGEAKTAAQWWDHLQAGRNRLGFKLLNFEDPDGAAEWERRKIAAANVPLEWADAAMIYQLAVLNGDYPVGLTGFHVAYAQKTPRDPASVRGLSADEYLQNMRATDRGMTLPWPIRRPSAKVPQ